MESVALGNNSVFGKVLFVLRFIGAKFLKLDCLVSIVRRFCSGGDPVEPCMCKIRFYFVNGCGPSTQLSLQREQQLKSTLASCPRHVNDCFKPSHSDVLIAYLTHGYIEVARHSTVSFICLHSPSSAFIHPISKFPFLKISYI